MGIFNRNQPNNVLFLMPVRIAGERAVGGRVQMLHCDADGRVCTVAVSRTIYQRAREEASRMERQHRPFATLGLEVGPGKYAPATVEITAEEVWALERMLEHALKSGQLPDILKKYIKPILELGESRRDTVISEQKKRQRQAPEIMPRVLDRLPYYPEKDIEVSVPIYKAEYTYPLVVLKRIPPDESTPRNLQKILILDSDGDIAVLEVPTRMMRQIEMELTEYNVKNNRPACVILSKTDDSIVPGYMTISQQQKKALETLTRYFEATGSSQRPISTTAKMVLVKARDTLAATG
jgi:hypothetical protein